MSERNALVAAPQPNSLELCSLSGALTITFFLTIVFAVCYRSVELLLAVLYRRALKVNFLDEM